MKNTFSYLMAIFSVMIVGCNDDFLDRYPETQINDNNFWNTASDLKIYNNQLYGSYFNGLGFGRGGFDAGLFTADNLSDNAFTQNPGDVRLGINSANQPGRTNWNWTLLRDINQFLKNVQEADIEESIKNIYIGEARLIRALDYYDKVKLYGDLPIIDRVPSEDDELLFATQSSRNEVLQFIKEDLDFAVQWLPENAEDNRFDKYVALSYKARIMLHEGTFRKYHSLGGENAFLEAAVSSASLVMESDRYLIDTAKSYNSLFANVNLNGNNEVIFYKDYDAEIQLYNNITNIITDVNGAIFGGSKSLIRDYLCTDGLPITSSSLYQGDDTIVDEFANRDLRLSGTFAQPNTYFVGDKLYLNSSPTGIEFTSSPSGYQVVKFYNANQESLAFNQDDMDAPLIRYAEVLLILAEGKAELGNITQLDINKTINLLRAKAGVSNLVLDPNTVINDIRRERRVELAFEGFRFDDLMRWKQGPLLAEPVLGLKFNSTDIADADDFIEGTDIFLNADGYIKSNNNYSFEESKNYYFPVPVNELSLNPNLIQTPGW